MNTNTPAYKVTKVVDSSSYDAQRGAHRTKQVHIQMADGTRTYVELPIDQFMPETVQQHVEQAVATHEQVMSLRPGVSPTQPPDLQNPFG